MDQLLEYGNIEGELLTHLVSCDIVLEACVTLRIQVVSPYKNFFLPCGYCKRSYTCHNIADGISGLKQLNETSMLSIEPAIPVNLGVIKAEIALFLFNFDIEIWDPREELIFKGTEGAIVTNVGGFIYHRGNRRILIQDDRGDQVFIWQVLLPKIEMRLRKSIE